MNLRDFGNAAAAPDQPEHAVQIENADPQPVPQAVVAAAMLARPVDDVDILDAITLSLHQRGGEAMQRVEKRQREINLAAKRLQPAAGVERVVLQNAGAHLVRD